MQPFLVLWRVYCRSFEPNLLSGDYPTILIDLFKPECVKLQFNELLEKCQKSEVEQATQTQADNRMWFRFRPGRVSFQNEIPASPILINRRNPLSEVYAILHVVLQLHSVMMLWNGDANMKLQPGIHTLSKWLIYITSRYLHQD